MNIIQKIKTYFCRSIRRYFFGLNKEEYLDMIRFISKEPIEAIYIARQSEMMTISVYSHLRFLERLGYIKKLKTLSENTSFKEQKYGITELGLSYINGKLNY